MSEHPTGLCDQPIDEVRDFFPLAVRLWANAVVIMDGRHRFREGLHQPSFVQISCRNDLVTERHAKAVTCRLEDVAACEKTGFVVVKSYPRPDLVVETHEVRDVCETECSKVRRALSGS